MKLLSCLILAAVGGSAFAQAPVVIPPEAVRRGEPAFALLAPLGPGRSAGDYSAVVRYADGSSSPAYTGFRAPAPASDGGRDVEAAGPSAAYAPVRAATFLFSAPIEAALGEASIVVFDRDGQAVSGARFTVADRAFSRQDLRLDAALTSLRVDPDPRKTEQAKRYQALLATADPSAVFLDSGFMRPVASERRTTLFGLRRRYLYADGGVDVTTHNGIDYGSPTGSEVVAAGSGRVVMAEDRIVTGKTVVVEHLPGAFTIYMHLDSIAVSEGDLVTRGDPLGAVGMTGLATGPHLHWEFRVRGVACDPEALVGLDKIPSIRTMVPAIEGG
ncbi:MAG: M23 family metallopeptidase [Spirochaetes bacterium]|nr:M23 family metallopeptidase [Spirochaetota bacterium]MBU1080685.1 M23 family metallopeptidase [Spirochaetota bacterium]